MDLEIATNKISAEIERIMAERTLSKSRSPDL